MSATGMTMPDAGDILEMLKALKVNRGRRKAKHSSGSGIRGPRGGTLGALLPFAKVIRVNKRPMRAGVWA